MTYELQTALADERYEEAKQLVLTTRNAGVPHLQRVMKIGFNRASRFVEAMQAEGLVSGTDHAGKRNVLAPPPAPLEGAK